MNTWQTLQMSREAWDIGRLRESWQLMDECQPDCEYVRRGPRTTMPRFVLDLEDDDNYPVWDPLPAEDQRREHRAEVDRIDWMAWQTWTRASASSVDAMLREMYDRSIASLAIRPPPFPPRQDDDSYTIRIRSYADIIVHRPSFYIPDGDP